MLAVAAALCLAATASAEPSAYTAGLQVGLRSKGLYGGPIDGIAGPGTKAAIRRLQRRAGLAVDGVAGPRTRRALGRLGRPLLGRRLLLPGMRGLDVSVLQFHLRRRGHDPGRLDGHFGERTRQALSTFQRRQRLATDGLAGPSVVAALRGRAAGRERPRFTRYLVRRGDTLTAIATRFGTTVPALARANDLQESRVLQESISLRIPSFRPGQAAAAATMTGAFAVRTAIDYWSQHYGVDPRLARALAWMESGYQPHVVSEAGAVGVMQVTPPTWDFVEEVLLGSDVPHTTEGNIRVGVAFLAHLLRRFEGDERLALAAYYQGAKAVRDHGIFPVSRPYVANILALKSRV